MPSIFVLDMITTIVSAECCYSYSLSQRGQAVLHWTNPLPAMIDQCPVAGRSCVGTPTCTVARLQHYHINASRRQFASRRKTRQSRADDHHIGLACWNI